MTKNKGQPNINKDVLADRLADLLWNCFLESKINQNEDEVKT